MSDTDTGLRCPRCEEPNAPYAAWCRRCRADLSHPFPEPELRHFEERLAPAPAPRRRQAKRRSPRLARWLGPSLRGIAAGYLVWVALDTGSWLSRMSAGLAPDDLAAQRYTLHALFELVRAIALALGLWLLSNWSTPRAE